MATSKRKQRARPATKKTTKQPAQPFELTLWMHCPLFLLACALIASRRPDAIFNPQFWAEDGHVWFADAYNLGWFAALFRAQDGYYQTLPRLAAALALLVPLSLAPLVLNLVAIAVQALPVSLLLSTRSSAWGTLRFRALLACIYVALPNCREMGACVTSSQWIMTLCAFLVLVASPPESSAGKLFDISILLLCGLTGPFCIFLFPMAVFLAWKRRDRWARVRAGILVALCLVQAWGLLIVDRSVRPHFALGASPGLFTRILAGHVYFAALMGHNALAASPLPFLCFLGVAIAGTAIVATCFAKSAMEMRLLLLLSAMLFAASLLTPSVYPQPGVSVWEKMAGSSGIRYWFFPTLAFAWSLLWCLHSRILPLKIVSACLLAVMCFGVVRDWKHPAYHDLHFGDQVRRFETAPAGTRVTFPVNPRGWTMQLVRQ